jgi:transcriptional regulator with XRE-family HTH domain
MKNIQNRQMAYGRGTGIPNPTDVHVGKRIRLRRLFLGMNQETLAAQLGVTFQQLQKYEGGANRVSASRLADIARILDVPVPHLFADLPPEGNEPLSRRQERARMEQSETIELLRFYYGISDEKVRQHFLDLVKSIAAQDQLV